MKVEIVNLLDLLESYDEEAVKKFLLNYRCPINNDVEEFLHHKAINFTKQRISITFLVCSTINKYVQILGYFSLANKVFSISCKDVSRTLFKKISKYSLFDSENNTYFTSIPLIAQLGKNFACNEPISGANLLSIACNKVNNIQNELGGKCVYLESMENDKLIDFYSTYGFVYIKKRGKYVQMLKVI